MDFLDPRKKRAHIRRLYIGYVLVAIAIGLGTLVILMASYGYGVDRHTGQVIQNGLVFVASTPGDAEVKVTRTSDGQLQQTATTASRLILPTSNYTITMNKQGYRSWQRAIAVDGGTVERLVYPFLFPNELTATTQKQYAARPSFVTNSPDRRWVVVGVPGTVNSFDVFDTGDITKAPTTLVLPEGVASAGTTHALELVEWSTDNKNLLLKHVFDGQQEFLLINRDNIAESLNISKALNTRADTITLIDKRADRLYLHTAAGGILQQANLKDKKVTNLLGNVLAYKSHGEDMLLYVTSESSIAGKAVVHLRENTSDYVLRDLPANSKYVLDLARFDGRWYVAVGAESDTQAYVYINPIDTLKRGDSSLTLPARTLRVANPQTASFSTNARFVAVQSGQNMVVYDAELDRQYRYEISEKLDSAKVQWMDGHRLLGTSNNTGIVFDFDGTNMQKLGNTVAGTLPLFDRDYERLFSLSAEPFTLTRSELRLP